MYSYVGRTRKKSKHMNSYKFTADSMSCRDNKRVSLARPFLPRFMTDVLWLLSLGELIYLNVH